VVEEWVRTNRRAPGSPWRLDDPSPSVHRIGPWHAIRGKADGRRVGGQPLSWCGRKPTSTTINVRRRPGADPPELAEGERLCPECVKRVAEGRPRAFRGKGRHQA